MATHKEETVLVTGATGFVGSHCVKLLLNNGYRVRGTVRDLTITRKIDPIRQLDTTGGERLQLVEANLSDPDYVWRRAVQDCAYILHVATPVPAVQPRNKNALMQPAVEGTLSVLRAAKASPDAKRIVICGSISSIHSGNVKRYPEMTAEVWSDPTSPYASAYDLSKIASERAVWQFAADNKGSELMQAFREMFRRQHVCPNILDTLRSAYETHLMPYGDGEFEMDRSLALEETVMYKFDPSTRSVAIGLNSSFSRFSLDRIGSAKLIK